jgi:hypothetical protein
MGLPRNDVVFRLWQCDKENHGWREGPPLTVPCQSFDLLAGPSLSRQKSATNEKKNTAFRRSSRPLTQNIGRFFSVMRQLTRGGSGARASSTVRAPIG